MKRYFLISITTFIFLNSGAFDACSYGRPFELRTEHDGVDLCPVLESTDSNYYVMPEVGQRATLTFPVPPIRPGLERTIFAKVSGYYDMHLDSKGTPQSEVVARINSEPGYVTKFALQEYFKWRKEQLAESEK